MNDENTSKIISERYFTVLNFANTQNLCENKSLTCSVFLKQNWQFELLNLPVPFPEKFIVSSTEFFPISF